MPAGGGYFAVYRSVFTKYEGRPEALAAWLWILSWTRFRSDGDLERGEVRISSRRLAAVMGWERTKARRFILKLLKTGEIRPANRPPKRPTLGSAFFVVNYGELQRAKNEIAPPTAPLNAPHVRRSKKEGKDNGVAEASKSVGGDAVLTEGPVTKKKPAAKKALSLDAQRAFLAAEIRKGEADA